MNKRNLIWVPPSDHKTVWKNEPAVLLCAMQPRAIDEWRRKNKWADHIEMIIFTDDTPPEAVRAAFACRAFAGQTGHAPHIVVNAPLESLAALDLIKATEYRFGADNSPLKVEQDAAMRYRDAVGAVGRALRETRCAWIQPESDHAVGACALTKEIGMVIAYSAKPMIDAIGVQAATNMGVNVRTLGQIRTQGGQL